MKFRFCPLCGSEAIKLFQKVITEEEERHTEVYGCLTCKKVIFREIPPYLEKTSGDFEGFKLVN